MTIYTIGHSTRPLEEFLELLAAHRIIQLADVRTVPRSRRHPQFAREAMEASLPRAGVAYRHLPGLGGLRKPRRDSTNTAWRNESFRGYADYMQTDEFVGALEELIAWAEGGPERAAPHESRGAAPHESRGEGPQENRGAGPQENRGAALSGPRDGAALSGPRTVIMCAEAVWWRCHRQLIADALVARGIEVCHITSASPAAAHTLSSFARVDNGRVTYPGLV